MSYHPTSGLGFALLASPCVTEAQRAEAVAACKKVQVKGLGATDPCAIAQLPLCGPGQTPVEDTGAETGADTGGNKTLMVGSILLLVVAAGGYALYRGAKKK